MNVLLQELLRLPRSREKLIYYSVLVVGMCKADSGFPSALGKSVRSVFSAMDNQGGMDCECVRRIGEWFSIHLSNFKYGWKWSEWYLFECLPTGYREPALQLPPTSMRHAFITQLIDCCVRLSYPDQVRAALPEAYASTPTVWDANGPRLNYILGAGNCDPAIQAVSQELLSALRIKDSAEKIQACTAQVREWVLNSSTPESRAIFSYPDAGML